MNLHLNIPLGSQPVLYSMFVQTLLISHQHKVYEKHQFNPLSTNPTKWSNTQTICNGRRIIWVCLTIFWGWRLKGCNVGQNICRFFHVLVQLLFTISGTELDHYHQKVSVRVPSRVAKRLKTLGLKNLGNVKKIPVRHPKAKFRSFLVKKSQKIICKTFHRKTILLNFVNLSTTLCPRM